MSKKSITTAAQKVRAAMGLSESDAEIIELQRKVNTITQRLFKQHLTDDERTIANALGVSYLDVLKQKLKDAGNKAGLAELATLEKNLKAAE